MGAERLGVIEAADPFGNLVVVERPDSVPALAGFAEGLLGYTPRILDVLPAAERDDSVAVQSCAAALQMFSESPSGPPAARAHLERARRAQRPCSERERLFATAIERWADGDLRGALALHQTLAETHPRDLVAVKIGQVHAFNLGDAPALLRLALAALPAAADIAWLHGMLAFGWEQCHRLDKAEGEARCALAMRPNEPWAQHALAHVMLTDDRLQDGAAFLQAESGGWRALTSFMRGHNWWHLALFHIELGDDAAALKLYDREVWGIDKRYSQDQVGAVSLLARLELAGVAVGDRWDELAPWLAERTADQVQPFLDLQYAYGLARAGRPEADALLANLERHAAQAHPSTREAWQRVALPACRGLVAHARGRWSDAVEWLTPVLPRLTAIGGSHAQRALFEQIHVDALQRAGHLADVQHLLQREANAHPRSERLRRRLHEVYGALGLPALAHH